MHITVVIGYLGKDPEYRQFENGGSVCNFSIAATERAFKTRDGREIAEHTEWYTCVAYNGLADTLNKYCKKGHKLWIEAKKRTRQYTASDGANRYVEEFIVKKMELLTPRELRTEAIPVPVPSEVFENTPEEQELPF